MQPRLYLFIGHPGAGKTTIARLIQERTGAVHIWADVERHKMFPNPSHEETESLELYKVLNERTEQLLSEGKSVIFDTNFNHRADRDFLRQIADRQGAETVVIWVTTPLEIAKQRAVDAPVTRNNYEVAMSDEQFDAIATKLEPPAEDEKVIKIDGTKLDEAQAIELLRLA